MLPPVNSRETGRSLEFAFVARKFRVGTDRQLVDVAGDFRPFGRRPGLLFAVMRFDGDFTNMSGGGRFRMMVNLDHDTADVVDAVLRFLFDALGGERRCGADAEKTDDQHG